MDFRAARLFRQHAFSLTSIASKRAPALEFAPKKCFFNPLKEAQNSLSQLDYGEDEGAGISPRKDYLSTTSGSTDVRLGFIKLKSIKGLCLRS